MKCNLNEHVHWMAANATTSPWAGFQYALENALKQSPQQMLFEFDKNLNAAHNSTSATLSDTGTFELDNFRRARANARIVVPEEPTITTGPTSTMPPPVGTNVASLGIMRRNPPAHVPAFKGLGSDDVPDTELLEFDLDALVASTTPSMNKPMAQIRDSQARGGHSTAYPSSSSESIPCRGSGDYLSRSYETPSVPSGLASTASAASRDNLQTELERLNREMAQISDSISASLRAGKVNTVLRGKRDDLEMKIAELSNRIQSFQDTPGELISTSERISDAVDVINEGFTHVNRRISYSVLDESVNSIVLSGGNSGDMMSSYLPVRSGLELTESWDDLADNGAKYAGSYNQSNQYRDGMHGNDYDMASSYASSYSSFVASDDPTAPVCHCGLASSLKTSLQQQSLNRKFYCCPLPRDDPNKCKYFQWEDEMQRIEPVLATAGIKDYRIAVKEKFGHNGFRHGQRECVEAALSGKDVFCLMPTGGGKSMVYQLPAVCAPGIAVVFSPLLSLIQDQVDAMAAIGIRAASFGSTKDDGESKEIFQELFSYHSADQIEDLGDRGIKMLYITPEKFSKSAYLKRCLKQLDDRRLLSRFVIDEAHCLSQWGHDFRPDYLALENIRTLYPFVPIMALTATANQAVVADSRRILQMRPDTFVHTQSFNRKNLRYEILKKDSKLIDNICKIIMDRRHQTGIVYCLSKKDTETVADEIVRQIPAMRGKITFYHADVRQDEREKRQKNWSKGVIKVICATIAFGMGINKPDVRYVIHHSIPKSLTNYYQESGRAGRDGATADCIMFYSYKDKSKLQSMIIKSREESGNGQSRPNEVSIQIGLENLLKCVAYCVNEVDCRRKLLLEYFGETFPTDLCMKTCDNCKRTGTVTAIDCTAHARTIVALLRLVRASGLPRLTLVRVGKLYSGSRDKEITNYHQSLQSVLKDKGEELRTAPKLTKVMIDRLLVELIIKQYLDEEVEMNSMGFGSDYVVVGKHADRLDRGDKVTLNVRKADAVSGSSIRATDNLNIPTDDSAIIPGPNKSSKTRAKSELKKKAKDVDHDLHRQIEFDDAFDTDEYDNENESWLSKPNKRSKAPSSRAATGATLRQGPADDIIDLSWSDKKPPRPAAMREGTSKSATDDYRVLQSNYIDEFSSDQAPTKRKTTSNEAHDSRVVLKQSLDDSIEDEFASEDEGRVTNRVSIKSNLVPEREEEYDSGMETWMSANRKSKKGGLTIVKSPKKKVKSPRGTLIGNSMETGKRSQPNFEYDSDDDFDSDKSPVSFHYSLPKKQRLSGESATEDGVSSNKFLKLSFKQRQLFVDWLTEFRQRWDSYWNYMNNSVMTELSEQVPVTIQELGDISGIGKSKASRHGIVILATIYAFLEKHDLLHLFPNAVAPTLRECPTWRDPLSEEARQLRKDLTEQQLHNRLDLNFTPSTTQGSSASGSNIPLPHASSQINPSVVMRGAVSPAITENLTQLQSPMKFPPGMRERQYFSPHQDSSLPLGENDDTVMLTEEMLQELQRLEQVANSKSATQLDPILANLV